MAVLAVLAISQAVGLVGVAVWVAVSGDPFPGVVELLPAAGAGAAGLLGLAALYRGSRSARWASSRRSPPPGPSSRSRSTLRRA